jgi:hypothetical protein
MQGTARTIRELRKKDAQNIWIRGVDFGKRSNSSMTTNTAFVPCAVNYFLQ